MAERVFLAHSSEDRERVRGLYRRLRRDGVQPWLDEEDLLPGQDWESEIRRAIRESRFVLVCLSESAVTRRGFVQKEIRQALDAADEQPEGSIFLIPVRLEPCQVPERLRSRHWVDLFTEGGYERLLLSLRPRRPPVGEWVPPAPAVEPHEARPPAHDKRNRMPRWLQHRRTRIAAVSVLLAIAAVLTISLATNEENPSTPAEELTTTSTASPTASSTTSLRQSPDPATPHPLGQPLTGHIGEVRSVAFSPDGNTLATGGSTDHAVILWDLTNRDEPRMLGKSLTGHTGEVTTVAFSPDGKSLASGSTDHAVLLWDPTGLGAPRRLGLPLTGHTGEVWSVAFSRDGRTLASCSEDNTVRLWDVANPSAPRTLGQPLKSQPGPVWSMAFSPDGKILASGSHDHTVQLWNVANPSAPRPLGSPMEGHTAGVWSVAFSPNGKILASGSDDHAVQLWNVANPSAPRPLGPPLEGHTGTVDWLAFSPDGQTLATVSRDHTVILWDLANLAAPRLARHLAGHEAAFAPDRATLAIASDDGTVWLWAVS